MLGIVFIILSLTCLKLRVCADNCHADCTDYEFDYQLEIGDAKNISLKLGKKSVEEHSLTANEMQYTLPAEVNYYRYQLKRSVKRVWLRVKMARFVHDSRRIYQMTMPPHFVRCGLGYKDSEIPGHRFEIRNHSYPEQSYKHEHVWLTAEYWFNSKIPAYEGASTWSVVLNCQCGGCLHEFLMGEKQVFYLKNVPLFDSFPWPPRVLYSFYNKFGSDIDHLVVQVKIDGEKPPTGRLFVRILGPRVRGSVNDFRGIIFRFDTVEYSGNNEIKFDIPYLTEDQKSQLKFVEKMKVANPSHLNTMYETEDYLAVAFQCQQSEGGLVKCSDFSSTILHIKSENEPNNCGIIEERGVANTIQSMKYRPDLHELNYVVKVGKEMSNGLQFAQVLMNEGSTLNMPPHFDRKERGFAMYEIPGHFLVQTEHFIETHARYAFVNRNRESMSFTAHVGIICDGVMKTGTVGKSVTVRNEWTDKFPKAQITKALFYNGEDVINNDELIMLRFEIDELQNGNYLYVRVLGPIVKRSQRQLRGIVYYCKYFIYNPQHQRVLRIKKKDVSEVQMRQLRLVQKMKRTHRSHELESMYEIINDPSKSNYIVSVFQCLVTDSSRYECTEPTQRDLDFQTTYTGMVKDC